GPIVDGSALPRLRTLMFDQCEIDSGAIETIVDATGLGGLVTLRFSECNLTDDCATELARATGFPNLTRLDLRMNHRVTRRGATALLASRNFPKFSDLDLHDCGVAPPQQVPFVLDAPDRPNLTVSFTDLTVRRRMRDQEMEIEIEARGSLYGNLFSQFDSCR